MKIFFGVVWFFSLIALGIIQLVLGFAGLEYLLGWWAGAIGLALALTMRLMLPMSIGSYFGAVYVMEWPWWVGVLIVVPGILFLIPGLMLGLYEDFKSRR